MQILIYSYNYHPEPIGIAPLMTELAEGLVKRGHKVRVVTAMPWYPVCEIFPQYQGNLYLTENRHGVKIQRCFVWARRERTFRNRALFEISFVVLSFFQVLRGERPDVILLTIPGLPVAIPARLFGWLSRTPVVLNLQDILPDAAVHVGLIKNPKTISLFCWLERFAYKMSSKISVIAEGFTKNLLKKGVPSDKIVEIPNWVNIDFIKPLAKENNYFRKKHQLEGKFIVMYSGNIALTQPLESLVEAAARLRGIPEIAIVIVGKEDSLERLERHRQRQNADNVFLLPFEPREKLPEMLAAANVGIVIQKKNVIAFNMPSKIQVLLASGRPIIAAVPENGTAAIAIEKSGGGLVVAPENSKALAEAILELYSNPEKAEILGKQGRKYAEEHYSFHLALDRYEKLFANVISKSAKI